MRWKTYNRHEAKFDHYEAVLDYCATWRVATGGMDRVQAGWGCSLKSHVH
jgi:hypothetical protein